MGLCSSRPKEDKQAALPAGYPRSDGTGPVSWVSNLWGFDRLDQELEAEEWPTAINLAPIPPGLAWSLVLSGAVWSGYASAAFWPGNLGVLGPDSQTRGVFCLAAASWALLILALALLVVVRIVAFCTPPPPKGGPPPAGAWTAYVLGALNAGAMPLSLAAAAAAGFAAGPVMDVTDGSPFQVTAAFTVACAPAVLALLQLATANYERHLTDLVVTAVVFGLYIGFAYLLPVIEASGAAPPSPDADASQGPSPSIPSPNPLVALPFPWQPGVVPSWAYLVAVYGLDVLWLALYTYYRSLNDTRALGRFKAKVEQSTASQKKRSWI